MDMDGVYEQKVHEVEAVSAIYGFKWFVKKKKHWSGKEFLICCIEVTGGQENPKWRVCGQFRQLLYEDDTKQKFEFVLSDTKDLLRREDIRRSLEELVDDYVGDSAGYLHLLVKKTHEFLKDKVNAQVKQEEAEFYGRKEEISFNASQCKQQRVSGTTDCRANESTRERSASPRDRGDIQERGSPSAEESQREEGPCVVNDYDDHLMYLPGHLIQARYEIVRTLGEGSFGKVAACRDTAKNSDDVYAMVALKIIINNDRYREAAKLEINVLQKLQQKDPESRYLCVKMLDWFDYHGHTCIAFEKLGPSVYDFMDYNGRVPFPMDQVRHISYQLCYAVKFMHDMKLTHTDLKPENILFVNSDYDLNYCSNRNCQGYNQQWQRTIKNSEIRLIDFGNAIFDHEYHTPIVSTREYRALECILEIGWSQPCDVWSIGAIMFELYTGHLLFKFYPDLYRVDKDAIHLAMMETILGPMPKSMLRQASHKNSWCFDEQDRVTRKDPTMQYIWRDIDDNAHYKPLREYSTSVRQDEDHSEDDSKDKDDSKDDKNFFDLISSMLEYNPKKRITLREALEHPYFSLLPQHQ